MDYDHARSVSVMERSTMAPLSDHTGRQRGGVLEHSQTGGAAVMRLDSGGNGLAHAQAR